MTVALVVKYPPTNAPITAPIAPAAPAITVAHAADNSDAEGWLGYAASVMLVANTSEPYGA